MDTIRVLVSGAGSSVGQGILKALRASHLPLYIISADIHPLSAGLFVADEGILWPKVESPNALSSILEVLKRLKIDVVMIGSEFDLEFFSTHREVIQNQTGSLVAVSHLKTVQIANDKFLTVDFLKKYGLPYAPSFLPASNLRETLNKAAQFGYPFILKPRCGTSSRYVYFIEDEEMLKQFLKIVPTPLIQRSLDVMESENEYTCSVFKGCHGELLGPFTARRILKGGHSWVVEIDDFKELHPLMIEIGQKMPILGSFNVQLIKTKGGPVPFEFNARFSGTVAVRAHFGFNEPEMFIRSYFLKERLQQPTIRKGSAFRYLEEIFIEGITPSKLKQPFQKGKVSSLFSRT